ncbi:MAG: PAS domain S-box protein [Clostridia bacterium]|nr:PAS domain S-box protein [Clostridia bacterium]
MTGKIFRSFLTASLIVLLLSLLTVTAVLYNYFGSVQAEELRDKLNLAADAVEFLGEEYLAMQDSDRYRLTWVDSTGDVLFDTHEQASVMENHADREEIREALTGGTGSSSRYSSTLMEKTIYEAMKLTDGTILRISVNQSTVGALLLGLLQPILLIGIFAAVLSGILARSMAKRIVEPLNRLDLDNPLENDAYDELSPLLNHIHSLHQKIEHQLLTLKRRQDEFNHITENMKEGLVLLDSEDIVLSINSAAKAIFAADGRCVGEDFLLIDRHSEVIDTLRKAQTHGHAELHSERNGRIYQFDISRIQIDGRHHGTVILVIDITEKEDAERLRREFSANVSHELKTPLQSIIGSADLIENGLVKPEDMPRFVGHIRKEASRLVTLIEDIIRLSQLDEGVEMPVEKTDLRMLADEVKAALTDAAQAKNVTVSVEGSAVVKGVRRLLNEILYNLCDNAIKYNTDGGRVDVQLSENENEAVVIVRDTGIGIAPEHHSRIFERFYRVDKSHSKASGGTGLGLSIVKHAVQLHHGKIEIVSAPGKGTAVTVVFPKDMS